jgi:hypothetical protein
LLAVDAVGREPVSNQARDADKTGTKNYSLLIPP